MSASSKTVQALGKLYRRPDFPAIVARHISSESGPLPLSEAVEYARRHSAFANIERPDVLRMVEESASRGITCRMGRYTYSIGLPDNRVRLIAVNQG